MTITSALESGRVRGYREADGSLTGFDYEKQAWMKAGRYIRCGHPNSMDCGCYGREHAGEAVNLDG